MKASDGIRTTQTRIPDTSQIIALWMMCSHTRLTYDPMNCTCKELCEELMSFAKDLGWEMIEIPVLVNKGKIEVGHHCALKNGLFILDPTADQFDYTSATELKANLTPWLFIKFGDDRYCSMNHLPYVPIDLSDVPEQCIVSASGTDRYKNCKFIFTD